MLRSMLGAEMLVLKSRIPLSKSACCKGGGSTDTENKSILHIMEGSKLRGYVVGKLGSSPRKTGRCVLLPDF